MPFLLALLASMLSVNPARAVMGGQDATGNAFASYVKIGNQVACSGIIVSDYVVATAAHCLVSGSSPVDPSTVSVYPPGLTLAQITQSQQYAVGVRLFYPASYSNPGSVATPNDIAFIVINKKIGQAQVSQFADFNTATNIINSGIPITLYGYGQTGPHQQPTTTKSMIEQPIDQQNMGGYAGFENTFLNFSDDFSASPCHGDSGAPLIAAINNQNILVAINSGSTGPCDLTNNPPSGISIATVAGEYNNIFNAAVQYVATLKPNPPTNVQVSALGGNASISWTAPAASIAPISGFAVKDQSGATLCQTPPSQTSCQVKATIGANTYSVYSVANGVLSNSATYTLTLTNATNPQFNGAQATEDGESLFWNPNTNLGNADPATISVEFRNGANGPILCAGQLQAGSCSFSYMPINYNIYEDVTSSLGTTTEQEVSYLDGVGTQSLVSRITYLYTQISTQLQSLLQHNPGYSTEITGLKNQIGQISSSTPLTREFESTLMSTRSQLLTLQNQTIENPRKISLTCLNGKNKIVVTAVLPKCSKGYTPKN